MKKEKSFRKKEDKSNPRDGKKKKKKQRQRKAVKQDKITGNLREGSCQGASLRTASASAPGPVVSHC